MKTKDKDIRKPATVENVKSLVSGDRISIFHKTCRNAETATSTLAYDEFHDRIVCVGCNNVWKRSFMDRMTNDETSVRFELSIKPSKIIFRLIEKTEGNVRYTTVVEEAVE